jgi:hypothetical protein
MHFVRNHGAVPRVDEEKLRSWTVRIHGLVERKLTFSLADLKAKFEVVTLPITLVCAGNRRKEQNVVRKSLGFNWGAAGGVSSRSLPAQRKGADAPGGSEHGALDGRAPCGRA